MPRLPDFKYYFKKAINSADRDLSIFINDVQLGIADFQGDNPPEANACKHNFKEGVIYAKYDLKNAAIEAEKIARDFILG